MRSALWASFRSSRSNFASAEAMDARTHLVRDSA